MTTDFFHQIAALGTPGNWKITIATKDNQNFIVSAQFSAPHGSDPAADLLPPLMFRGTPETLSAIFFRDIKEPVMETAEVFSNMEEYRKQLEQFKQQSKETQDKKRAVTVPAKKEIPTETEDDKLAKEEKKRAYEEAMKTVTAYIPLMKYAEALEILPLAEDYPEKRLELTAKRQELEKLVKLKEKSLFAFNQD
jgi:hypothetical protein